MLFHRFYTLDWLIKAKWDSGRKITAPHGFKIAYKPLGVFWAKVFELCLDVFATENAIHKFSELFLEMEIEGLISSSEHRKKEIIKKMQEQNRQLADLENPFHYPATKAFVDKAIYKSTKYNKEEKDTTIFKREKWNPFRKARAELLKEIRTDRIISLKLTEEGKIFWCVPTGKSKSGRATHIKQKPLKL